jgi:hypothetical protein
MAYKNTLLDLADRYPIGMSLIGFALVFELPSRFIGKSYRQIKHGNFKLGSDFGALPANRPYAPAPDQGIYKGDLYRDTTHMNRYAASGPQGKSRGVAAGDPFYNDTRHMTPTKPTPTAQESLFFGPEGTVADRKRHRGNIGADASQSLVNMHTGSSVFAGLSGVNKLWGGRK